MWGGTLPDKNRCGGPRWGRRFVEGSGSGGSGGHASQCRGGRRWLIGRGHALQCRGGQGRLASREHEW